MDKYSLQRRSRSEARVLAIKYEKFKDFKYDPINENFFRGVLQEAICIRNWIIKRVLSIYH